MLRVSVKEAILRGRVKKGAVHKAVIVRTAKEIVGPMDQRSASTVTLLLINANGELIGTRIFSGKPVNFFAWLHEDHFACPEVLNGCKIKRTPRHCSTGKDKGRG
ncbi:uL14 family ribosomal protein [Thalassospira alkalitolerans]|uniref:uL14 family ribosomal protein n=1 Tax=Thalassospira alkalitolerans TaxID=1293890 RepID=UPI003AA7AEA8